MLTLPVSLVASDGPEGIVEHRYLLATDGWWEVDRGVAVRGNSTERHDLSQTKLPVQNPRPLAKGIGIGNDAFVAGKGSGRGQPQAGRKRDR